MSIMQILGVGDNDKHLVALILQPGANKTLQDKKGAIRIHDEECQSNLK